jgi:hypothetical protein
VSEVLPLGEREVALEEVPDMQATRQQMDKTVLHRGVAEVVRETRTRAMPRAARAVMAALASNTIPTNMLTPKTNAYVATGISFTRVSREGNDSQIIETEIATTLAQAKQYLADGWNPSNPRTTIELLAALIEDVKAG